MLPIGGIVVGVIGLLVGVIALVQASGANKKVAAQEAAFESRIGTAEQTANAAADKANQVARDLNVRVQQTQQGFDAIAQQIQPLQTSVARLEDAMKRPAVAGGSKKGGEVVAGPGEYIVKTGDTSGAKIARDHGISLADLMAVNPGVDWNHMRIGQKLKLPSTAKK
jgi:LysM repeat protein